MRKAGKGGEAARAARLKSLPCPFNVPKPSKAVLAVPSSQAPPRRQCRIGPGSMAWFCFTFFLDYFFSYRKGKKISKSPLQDYYKFPVSATYSEPYHAI